VLIYKKIQHGSNNAVFHECSNCNQVIFVTAEINGELYGAINANHLNNNRGFLTSVEIGVSSQAAIQKKERWRKIGVNQFFLTINYKSSTQ